MKNSLCIFLLALLFAIPCGYAEETALAKDTIRLEAVSFDSTAYRELKMQKRFHYYNQQPDNPNILEDLYASVFRWLARNFKPDMTPKQYNVFITLALIAVVILFIVFLYFYKPALFYLNRKHKLNYRLEDEDIEGLNFDRLVQQALDDREYAEAIRWTYLKVLKFLNDRELISFDPYKTANEYVYELKHTDFKTPFRDLSRQFIYYRYGNGVATLKTFERFRELAEKIV